MSVPCGWGQMDAKRGHADLGHLGKSGRSVSDMGSPGPHSQEPRPGPH